MSKRIDDTLRQRITDLHRKQGLDTAALAERFRLNRSTIDAILSPDVTKRGNPRKGKVAAWRPSPESESGAQ